MDYLDYGKEVRQQILLWLGYFLVAIAIVIASLILVYQAYGFNLGKNNTVIQNGLVFLSSHPNPANIYFNDIKRSQQTDARLIMPSGVYKLMLSRDGYRSWSRTVVVNGGTVAHFDYPLLIPNKLIPTKVTNYSSLPQFITQSPDRRWVLIEKPGSILDFDLYDLKNPVKPTISNLTLPTNLLNKSISSSSFKLISWADDNQHILIEHTFDENKEFILLNRADPSQSLNLSTTLNISSNDVNLNNKKFDSYYSLDVTTGNLRLYKLNNQSNQIIASHVLAYKTYGSSSVLYATPDPSNKKLVEVKLISRGTNYPIKTLPLSNAYLLDLTSYSGILNVAVGSNNSNKIYIFADPVGQLASFPHQALIPLWVLHVNQVNYISFSNNAQFILAENANYMAVYDFENNLGYTYNTVLASLDNPQTNVNWMDGDRIVYVSLGKINIFDYDHHNIQSLVPSVANYQPYFSSSYKYMFNLTPNSTGQFNLEQTPLLTPPDL